MCQTTTPEACAACRRTVNFIATLTRPLEQHNRAYTSDTGGRNTFCLKLPEPEDPCQEVTLLIASIRARQIA